jgi:CRISPR-associated endonuclease/helicase Cas3
MFFAHSVEGEREPSDRWQPLSEHLTAVARLAGQFAKPFNRAELAAAAGLLHDLGKYSNEFQRRLQGGPPVDHATWGAKVAIERYARCGGYLLAYTIAGHHAGLANGAGEGRRIALRDRLQAPLPALLPAWQNEIRLPDALPLPIEFVAQSEDRFQFRLAFLVRMLFSCLVDADFLDTEAFYTRIENAASRRRSRAQQPSLDTLRTALDHHLADFDPTASDIAGIRARVLGHVRENASCDPGLFSLTVPTGGGKTLASLAFALDHAVRHGLERVIFVIPFTSIVEQNAAVFRQALGEWGDAAVLEHHSAFVDDSRDREARDKTRLAMENWDSPVVVTTAVQFFESLFADRPSHCRKLHNIANSVVVLDEAQTIPLHVLRPCVAALDELALNYRSSIVLCTATQPALLAPQFEGGFAPERVRELAPEPDGLARQLKRVRVMHVGTLDDAALIARLRSREQVLCIVNNRRHARALYDAVSDLRGARHLTTFMCARHRSEVLAEVRAELRDGRPCRLIATSLVEAGVDVSFPTVLRAEAGLDSIAQAAGRCNREGRWRTEDSEVLVFANENEEWAPPKELEGFAVATREVLRGLTCDDDPIHPSAVRAYFEKLYWQRGSQALDREDLLGLLRKSRPDSLPMDTVAEKFRMIESAQFPVIIPWDAEAESALAELEFAQGSIGIARRLQPYVVQISKRDYDALTAAHAIAPVRPDRWGHQFIRLLNASLYCEDRGLRVEDAGLLDVTSLVI